MEKTIKEMLTFIDPSSLSYQEWIDVGMALQAEGMPCELWEEWSAPDPRHKPGECFSKWQTFSGSGTTGATLTHMAKQNGWTPKPKSRKQPKENRAIGFDEEIEIEPTVETIDPTSPLMEKPEEQAIAFLRAAFKPGDMVNIVTAAAFDGGKWKPSNRGFTAERDELIRRLEKGFDMCIGDRNKSAGVWIRTNPTDGKGIGNSNITDFRHCLVESDSLDLKKQIEIYKRLNLPISTMTLSGGKSVHALVKIDAGNVEEFKARVRQVFDICTREGLEIDGANKNPARLTRLAGAERDDHQQSLLAINIGASSFQEWIDTVEIDELPEYESLASICENPPELPPETIRGILRKGEKMVLTGPSKAGKSFALISLCVALATGSYWMGRIKCLTQRVAYINFELTREAAAVRLLDVWKELRSADTEGMENLCIWNLRGTIISAKEMVNTIIHRHKAMSNPPDFYVVDPIYKLNAGDENAAKDINDLLREFDRLCSQTGANLVYAHHHAKGSQYGKRALDRGSGSGVIGRDADAAIDLDFLSVPEKLKKEKADYYHDQDWMKATGLRVEMTLRNFAGQAPFNIWFKYPVHRYDGSETFQDLKSEAEKGSLDRAEDGKAAKKMETDQRIQKALDELLEEQEKVRIGELIDLTGLGKTRIKRFIDDSEEYSRDSQGYLFPEKGTGTREVSDE